MKVGEWIVMVNPGASDKHIYSMCQGAVHGGKLEGHPSEGGVPFFKHIYSMSQGVVHGGKLEGHPSEGGVPFFEMRGTKQDLEAIICSAPGV